MFAFNSMLSSKKRGREEDDEPTTAQWWMGSPPTSKRVRNSVDGLTINVNGAFAQQQHRPSLPHHATSFRLRPQIDSPLMTADSNEQTPTAPAFSTGSSPAHSPPHAPEPADMDIEGDSTVVSIVQSSPPSPWNVPILGRPPKRSPPPLRSTPADRFPASRVPTPIYSSFPQNAQQAPRTTNGFPGFSSQPSRLPSLNTAIQTLQRRDHIMPSPVREADDEMEAEYAFAGSQLSRLSFSSGADGPGGFEDENLGMELDDNIMPSQASSSSYNWMQNTPDRYDDHTISPLSRSPNLSSTMSGVFSRKEGSQTRNQTSSLPMLGGGDQGMMSPPLMSPRTGRARSGAMSSLVSPTFQMTEGGAEGRTNSNARKFAFGPRDDCEKCRAKVAGHYAHFL